jgi:hypothetical protein
MRSNLRMLKRAAFADKPGKPKHLCLDAYTKM